MHTLSHWSFFVVCVSCKSTFRLVADERRVELRLSLALVTALLYKQHSLHFV